MTGRQNWRLLLVIGVFHAIICGQPASALEPSPSRFTPLIELAAPKIVAHAETYPGATYLVEHLVDGWGHTEYASNGKGTETYVEFDFGKPVTITGFRHQDRQDVATVASSELLFSNQPDFSQVLQREEVSHVNQPAGITFAVLSSPVTARYVRWQATELNAEGHQCLGGADLRFLAAQEREDSLHRNQLNVQAVQALLRKGQELLQPLEISIDHKYAEPVDALIKVGHLPPVSQRLKYGTQSARVLTAAVDQETKLPVVIEVAGEEMMREQLTVQPVRHWELIFLPHSHVDIGYTHVQTEVERRQWKHLEDAIEIARNTADYPAEARFQWNCEVLWAVDSYLAQATQQQQAQFFDAVRKGWLHLDGLYGNELTALCRPEELMHLTECARRISKEHDVVIDAAMISDVPGYTWGLVPVLAQSGIRYLSIGPNHIHRIGRTLEQWGDRPFWWVSPSGQERVLCWMAGKAYSWFHDSRVGILNRDSQPEPFFEYLDELTKQDYPYDMVQVRYSIGGDNGPPDQELSEFVKRWNETYVWPRMSISTTSRLMREFERRYGDQVPEVQGDFTPYWEDGAASSAQETSMARVAAERLLQAETVWALRQKEAFPAEQFRAAWRDVLLYNEHTWGAHCSISQPDSPFTRSQWKIKQAFATRADEQSRQLLNAASRSDDVDFDKVVAIDVYNTNSWARTDLVTLDADLQLAGHVVRDMDGQLVPSQVVRPGKLAFLASDVPALGAKRFLIEAGQPQNRGSVRVADRVVSNDLLRLELDPKTGAVSSLRWRDSSDELVDRAEGAGVGQYYYVAGRDPKDPQTSRAAEIRTGVPGGLIGTLIADAQAPGCERVVTMVRLIDGLDRADITVMLNKQQVREKEAVHIGFPFHVPGGVMRMNIPWAVMQPNEDQLPGACKNYLTVGRWVDISNDQGGVTWSTVDAPLVEVGDIRMDVSKPFGVEHWVQELEPSQTFYSYVMNNYWETNYKASQEGWVAFRYSVRPHRQYDQAAAVRFGREQSQPLIAAPADMEVPVLENWLTVEPAKVIVTSMKPVDQGRSVMVRLWNAGRQPAQARLAWNGSKPERVMLTSPRRQAAEPLEGSIDMPPLGIVTVQISR